MSGKIIALTALLGLAPVLSASAQDNLTGCEAKKADIQRQIDYARAHNNTHQVDGLEKALRETQAHCTESGLQREREADVRKKQYKVEEKEQELAEARASGREDKIRKKQKQLEEARDELAEVRAELNR